MNNKTEWQPWIDLFISVMDNGSEQYKKHTARGHLPLFAAALTCAKHHPDAPQQFYLRVECAFCLFLQCSTCPVPHVLGVSHCAQLDSYQDYTHATKDLRAGLTVGQNTLTCARAAVYRDAMRIYRVLHIEFRGAEREGAMTEDGTVLDTDIYEELLLPESELGKCS